MSGNYCGNLPCLDFENGAHSSLLSSAEFLHKSLGHVSYHRIRKKLGIPLKIIKNCESCAVSKITKASFKSVHKPASRPFEELHMDIIGPIWPSSYQGHRYILTIVDSCTRFCAAIPIKLKSEVADTVSYLIDVEAKRFGYYPTTLHSDRGSEFLNSILNDYCVAHLIKQRTSDAYTPQQNGLAERFNRTILESMRTILEDSKIQRKYWNEIAKLNPKGKLGRLIGYTDELRSYRILSDEGKIIETKSVQFLEYTYPESTDDDWDITVEEEKELEHEEEEKDANPSESSDESTEEIAKSLNPASVIPPGRILRERTSLVKPRKTSGAKQ
ncbi:hypothetical protein VP01_2104g6 [Puccinia sorghi]|uniref:Integrase catalytic domain-containing protein n=1 Tax=Puccinia sorghi TaxID=27349 RepID=A0A0L6VA43_9BASI|nr:hypothetical protein VP01_2104g6 [Puccinia sorghi]